MDDPRHYRPPSFRSPRYNDSSPLFYIRSHIFVLAFCYIVGVLDFSVLLILPAVLLLLINWQRGYNVFTWTTELKTEYHLLRESVIRTGESVNWINQVVAKWWTCCSGTVTKFVMDWVEPIVEKFKFPMVVESIKILSFDSGPSRIKFSNMHLMHPHNKFSQNPNDLNIFTRMTMEKLLKPPVSMEAEGYSIIAFEVDIDFDVPAAEFKMKARIGSKSVYQNLVLNIESFHIAGRLRCVFCTDKKADFPHVTTGDICFVENPIINIHCRILKDIVSVSNTPVMKQFMEKYIAYGFQKLLVYPGRQHIDFTPTPLPGLEWVEFRKFGGLSEGVVTVQIECENIEAVKKTMMQNYYCKLRFGSQKCIRECTDGTINSWSSTFSFLVHDPTTENLLVKLKSKRKMLRNTSVAKREINLNSLGITQQNEHEKSYVRMSSDDGSLQLLLSLFYTPLPQFSLLQHNLSLDNCDTSEAGVLYIHVHSARNLIGQSATSRCDPFCVVKQGDRQVFKTHTLYNTRDPVWEKGVEILVPWSHNVPLSFTIQHNSYGLGSHDVLGSAHLTLHSEQSQLIQYRLALNTNTKRITNSLTSQSMLYISVVFRNVESVNWTRDSLQETFLQRTHRHSSASCLDITTKFLNPTNEGFESSFAENNCYSSSDDN